MKFKVIMVSDEYSRKYIQDMHMTYAASLEQALELAEEETGENADIVVIPDRVRVVADGHLSREST